MAESKVVAQKKQQAVSFRHVKPYNFYQPSSYNSYRYDSSTYQRIDDRDDEFRFPEENEPYEEPVLPDQPEEDEIPTQYIITNEDD